LLASIVSAIVFQLIACIAEGYVDPFFIIALPPEIGIAFVIALLTGLSFTYRRKKQEPKKS